MKIEIDMSVRGWTADSRQPLIVSGSGQPAREATITLHEDEGRDLTTDQRTKLIDTACDAVVKLFEAAGVEPPSVGVEMQTAGPPPDRPELEPENDPGREHVA